RRRGPAGPRRGAVGVDVAEGVYRVAAHLVGDGGRERQRLGGVVDGANLAGHPVVVVLDLIPDRVAGGIEHHRRARSPGGVRVIPETGSVREHRVQGDVAVGADDRGVEVVSPDLVRTEDVTPVVPEIPEEIVVVVR